MENTLMSDVEKIRELWEDEESKIIFQSNIMYRLFGDVSAFEYSNNYIFKRRDAEDFVDKIRYNDKKLVFFGAGVAGEVTLEYLRMLGIQVAYFVDNNQKYQDNVIQIKEILMESGLYQEKNGEIIPIDKDYEQGLETFYDLYGEAIGDSNAYYNIKKMSGLYDVYEDGTLTLKNDVTELQLSRFYESQLKDAITLLAKHSSYIEYYKYNNTILDIGGYVGLVLACMTIYSFIPLIIKRGRTIGKLIFRIEVVSQDDNKVSIGQMLIRGWTMTFIMLLAMRFYFISVVIAIIVYFVNKNHHSLLDICSVSKTKDIVKAYEYL